MNLKAIYPVIGSTNVKDTTQAFVEHLGLTPFFEESWYVHLMNPETQAQIGIVDSNRESVPSMHKESLKGIVTIEPEGDV